LDLLELVEVEKDDRGQGGPPTGSRQGELEVVEDQGTVGQPGEGVMEGGIATHLGGAQLAAGRFQHVGDRFREGDFVLVGLGMGLEGA
jgi:hypothetical protein